MNLRHHRLRHGKKASEDKRLLVKQAQPPMEDPNAPPTPDTDPGVPPAGGNPRNPTSPPRLPLDGPPSGSPDGPGAAPPGPHPPGTPPEATGPLGGDPLLRPREPGPGPAQVEVNVESATGEITISKGNVNLKVAGESGSMKPNSDAWNALFESDAPDYEDDPLAKDTHDNLLAIPKHRTQPPEFDVQFTCESEERAMDLAFNLNSVYGLAVDQSTNTVTASGVLYPVGLMAEIGNWAIESKVLNEDLTKYIPGMKVAVVKDFPDMNYYPQNLFTEATIMGKLGGGVLLDHPQWGYFVADPDELGPANV